MKEYEIISEVRGAEQFLVVRQTEDEKLNDYLIKMMEHNVIAGLLPLRCRNMNGRTALYFQVGNLYRVKELIRNGAVGSREARALYAKLAEAIGGMGEYFLNVDQCVYEMEYFYVDAALNPFFLYLPFEQYRRPEINSVWRDFFAELLTELTEDGADPFYDTLMRYLIRPDFSMEEFKKIVSDVRPGDVSLVISAQEQLGGQEAQTTKEEEQEGAQLPAQTGKKGLKNSLFGFGKRKEERQDRGEKPAKAGKTEKARRPGMNIPGQKPVSGEEARTGKAERVSVPEEKRPPAPAAEETQGSGTGEQWSETVYLSQQEEAGTVMLNITEPYLIHGGVRIPMARFPFTVGKGSTCYVVANPTVSRIHMTITQHEGRFYVQDEHSSNGTWLDGERLIPGQPKQIRDGGKLRLSNEEITFHET